MDILSIVGVLIGIAAIIGGNAMEGGHISGLANGPAAVIVIGGTVGAAMLQTPMPIFRHAFAILRWIFFPPTLDMRENINKVISWSMTARKEGLLGLERMVEEIDDIFIRKGLQLLVDGNEPGVIRQTLELDIDAREARDLAAAKVPEAMGGYAPTIGIIGAVMGLIHVMGNLADPSKLGGGIAVAFVATIYGVALANLLFLPAANKLKAVVKQQSRFELLVTEGLVSIAEGENPRIIEARLQGLV